VNLVQEVERQSRNAVEAGLRGVVCSPLEVSVVRGVVGPGQWVVVPGIRRAGEQPGDQTRVATPADAIQAGATHLVVGRPVLEAPDPAVAFQALLEEVA
jgi:orotidine-5'-phosphate decarboxylase